MRVLGVFIAGCGGVSSVGGSTVVACVFGARDLRVFSAGCEITREDGAKLIRETSGFESCCSLGLSERVFSITSRLGGIFSLPLGKGFFAGGVVVGWVVFLRGSALWGLGLGSRVRVCSSLGVGRFSGEGGADVDWDSGDGGVAV